MKASTITSMMKNYRTDFSTEIKTNGNTNLFLHAYSFVFFLAT